MNEAAKTHAWLNNVPREIIVHLPAEILHRGNGPFLVIVDDAPLAHGAPIPSALLVLRVGVGDEAVGASKAQAEPLATLVF